MNPTREYEAVLEGLAEGAFAANFGPNWDTGVTVGGMAAGIDPDLSAAMADLVAKIRKKKLKPDKPRRALSRTGTMVDAILAVKALKAVQYLQQPG